MIALAVGLHGFDVVLVQDVLGGIAVSYVGLVIEGVTLVLLLLPGNHLLWLLIDHVLVILL